MTEIDVNYSDLVWWNWGKGFLLQTQNSQLVKGKWENGTKRERGFKSSGFRLKSSGSRRSTGSGSSRMSSKEKAMQEKLRVAELRTEASFMKKKKREVELQAESLRLEVGMSNAEARVKSYEQEKQEAKWEVVVTEESGKTRKYTWDGPLFTEQKDQRKNYMILRDKHQRDKETGNKEGIKMTTM